MKHFKAIEANESLQTFCLKKQCGTDTSRYIGDQKLYFIMISFLKFTNLFQQFSITLRETFGRYVVLLQCLQNFDKGWNGPKGGLMTC